MVWYMGFTKAVFIVKAKAVTLLLVRSELDATKVEILIKICLHYP